MAIAGVDHIVAFGSSGSLKTEIAPGTLLIPTDYISVTDIPSIHDHKIEHVRPELPRVLAEKLSSVVPEARLGGVYVQTRGPRIETVAEVAALAKVADVVGMTVASEATLACELGMDFAALCTIDTQDHPRAVHSAGGTGVHRRGVLRSALHRPAAGEYGFARIWNCARNS